MQVSLFLPHQHNVRKLITEILGVTVLSLDKFLSKASPHPQSRHQDKLRSLCMWLAWDSQGKSRAPKTASLINMIVLHSSILTIIAPESLPRSDAKQRGVKV